IEKITNIVHNGQKINEVEIPIYNGLSSKDEILISSNSALKAFVIKEVPMVKFKYSNLLSHIIGYTGPVTEQELLSNSNLTPYDIVGRYGIEQSFNKYLMGQDGLQLKEVNTYGQIVSSYGEKKPVAGDNVQLNISSTIQKEMQSLLIQSIKTDPNHVTGAVGIVENVNTGGILAMVSYPTFNNNAFEGAGISNTAYNALLSNPMDPLLNRAISEQQPVGSIMKTILLSAALQDNVLTPNTTFTVPGTFLYDGTLFQNYAKINWGTANIAKCLQFSINVFAFKASIKLGIQRFVKFEKLFGLGKATGIQLPGELSGIIADPKTKLAITGQPWYPGDLLNSAIGQGYTEVTPIQVVSWISAIANGGTLYTPRIVKAIYNQQGQVIKNYAPQVVRKGFVSTNNLNVIKYGMEQAVQNGIDIAAKSVIADNAGKSGTAQFGNETISNTSDRYSHSHSWMASFAPYKNPQIAVVVFEENGGLSTYAAEVVKNFMNWYFGVYLKK
ncbi:MAG: penicillin-binding transpeptidase domain-containing protein, partial [Patescibacteria group bacterium]